MYYPPHYSERAGAGAEEDGDVVGVVVGDGQVEVAVAVEVAGGHRSGGVADAVVGGGSEGAGAGTEEDGDVVGKDVGDGQVEVAVAVEVPGGHRGGGVAGAVVGGRAESGGGGDRRGADDKRGQDRGGQRGRARPGRPEGHGPRDVVATRASRTKDAHDKVPP